MLLPALERRSRDQRECKRTPMPPASLAPGTLSLANGSLPATLDALGAAIYRSNSGRFIDGKPLRYRPDSKGVTHILRCWNKADDGGELAWLKERKTPCGSHKGRLVCR